MAIASALPVTLLVRGWFPAWAAIAVIVVLAVAAALLARTSPAHEHVAVAGAVSALIIVLAATRVRPVDTVIALVALIAMLTWRPRWMRVIDAKTSVALGDIAAGVAVGAMAYGTAVVVSVMGW